MKPIEISFETILPVWRDKLWPGRGTPIKPVSSMVYQGGYDMGIYEIAKPRFFGIFAEGTLIGVNSGFTTAPGWFRSRGMWVSPDYQTRGLGRALMEATEQAAREAGAEYLWTVPRQTAMPFYKACGFEQTSDWFDEGVEFGPNAYALKRLV